MTEPRSLRHDLPAALGAGAAVVVFCIFLLWRDPLFFWNDDYQISILPVFADVARSWSAGHWPLLSPYSWVCSNLAGEFQYGTFSIFVNAVVVLIWKLPLAFAQQAAALSMAHLFVLAMGAFLLARQRKFPAPLAFFVALVATLNGWNICWGATDWFGALGAFAWLPWAWWGLERSLEKERGRWRFLWPAPFVYLVVTGGFPYTVVMLGVIAAWLALRSITETRSVRLVIPLLLGSALGFGLSAPAWLALLDYVQGSGRAASSASAHRQWVVPLAALPGFILPCWTVNWADFSTRYVPHGATELAGGLVPPVAILAGLVREGRVLVRRIRWDMLLLLLLLLVSMLPSAGVFRWSFRWLPLIHLVMALAAAEALQSEAAAGRGAILGLSSGMIGLVLVAFCIIAMQFFQVTGANAFPFAWILLGFAGIWAATDLWLHERPGRNWLPPAIAFGVFLVTYLCLPTSAGVPKYNFPQELAKPAPLDPQRLYLAVYSPAEYAYQREYREGPVGQIARPGSTPMWAGLRFINGYSPIHAAGVAREFTFFTHGEIDGEVGKYLVENQAGPAGILEQLGVDGIVIARQIPAEPPPGDWQLLVSNNEGRVFHHRGAPYPQVRSITWIDSRPNHEFSAAAISRIVDERNSIRFEVNVPNGEKAALLTVSRPYFRGYEARLGKNRLKVDSYRGLFPTVEVPPGSSGDLVLAYRPRWLIYGGACAALCALVCAGAVIAAVAGVGDPGRP